MNRATMRDMLRKRINEETANDWTDTQLNSLLDVALGQTQRKVLRFNPLAFLAWYRAPITANESFYRRPIGSWWEYCVEVKLTAAATQYTELVKRPYRIAREALDSAPVYAKLGTFLAIYPTPTETVTAGLQVIHTPLLTFPDDDIEVDLHTALHLLVVVRAHKLALANTPETQAHALVLAEIRELEEDMAFLYGRTDLQNEKLWLPPESVGRDDSVLMSQPRGIHYR